MPIRANHYLDQARITRETALGVCLCGIILIILTEMSLPGHCGWHHSLTGILDYRKWWKGAKQKQTLIAHRAGTAAWSFCCLSFTPQHDEPKQALPGVVAIGGYFTTANDRQLRHLFKKKKILFRNPFYIYLCGNGRSRFSPSTMGPGVGTRVTRLSGKLFTFQSTCILWCLPVYSSGMHLIWKLSQRSFYCQGML